MMKRCLFCDAVFYSPIWIDSLCEPCGLVFRDPADTGDVLVEIEVPVR